MIDEFGIAGIRERVLAAWAAAPVRFREDANAEEDLALGGYLDRVVVELAQNAADAAARAGVPGRVQFSLRGGTLVVSNTGAPLTAEGVESLATLRASAKRDDSESAVGRFGVGFSAVLAVTDEPVILSRSGGVRFSRADSAAAVAAVQSPSLDTEVRRRDGQVPVLRLPFEAEGEPPEGYDTAVILPLRDEAAAELVRRLLAAADDALLLALPGLERIEIDLDGSVRELADVESRWFVQRASGVLDESDRERLLADRPTEERARPYWSVLWALPRSAAQTQQAESLPTLGAEPFEAGATLTPAANLVETGSASVPGAALPGVVHAPTPTDEPLSLPALLLATFPLDPSRRHVAAGPLTDRLVQEAAAAYAELLRARAEDGAKVLSLVPTGLAAGALDRALRDAILAALPGTPILRAVEDGAPLRPRDAVVVEGSDAAFDTVLAPIVNGLVGSPRQDRTALDALGVRRLDLAELVDQLGSVAAAESPAWWQGVYGALSAMVTDPLLRESLGTLPVPLADGRLVRGVRGLLLPSSELPAGVLATFGEYGVRVVHPEAVHSSLERLGALPLSARALLEDSAVRSAVEHSAEADDPDVIADAVLTVVAADVSQAEGLWWLSDLVLRDADGELVPANALVIAGSDAAAVLDEEEVAPIDHAVVERYGLPAVEAVGVLNSLGTVSASDVTLDELPEALKDLDGIEDWADDVAPDGSRFGVTVGELIAVRDLDWIVDDAWPRVLELFGTSPELRRALVETVRVIGPDDRPHGATSYSAWWIRERVLLADGEPLAGRADPEAYPILADFLDAAPDWTARLDPEVRTAVGLVRVVSDLDAAGVELLLDRLADPERAVEESALLRLWSHLGVHSAYPGDTPDDVRVLDGSGVTTVMSAGESVVADAPMWLQRTDLGGFVVASGAAADGLSDLLDVPMAGEVADGNIDSEGSEAEVPELVRELVPEAPTTWWEHEELTVDGVEVSWWVDENRQPHAATFDGLAKALAWSSGRWDQRHVIRAVLSEPDRATELRIDATFD
ncbi:sacsin N-terminal ATP-binding-like domain-containing protein [Kribbella sp. CA-293567]|uniref:sacsin N-terminal ATP-binding-like domain-containing protein n=1 Tax=Kribbella sp. CA-293567 TaxID=3002436 RepID=UPI0022DDB244|nr:hypothetical protein [Kribbella sp. CA-293567]WBQ08116.1 hypothetical protein OX958_15230 [Kribbella sp. CA-293567]